MTAGMFECLDGWTVELRVMIPLGKRSPTFTSNLDGWMDGRTVLHDDTLGRCCSPFTNCFSVGGGICLHEKEKCLYPTEYSLDIYVNTILHHLGIRFFR